MNNDFLKVLFEDRFSQFQNFPHERGIEDGTLSNDPDILFLEADNVLQRLLPDIYSSRDHDGLIKVQPNLIDQDGLMTIGDLVLVPSIYFRKGFSIKAVLPREIISSLLQLAQEGHDVRIAIDLVRVGIRASWRKLEQRDYWWGPPYKGNPAQQQSGLTVHRPDPISLDRLDGLLATEYWVYGKSDSSRTFEIEELHDRQDVIPRGMRFLHSICDKELGPHHIDGAIRFYDDEAWQERQQMSLSTFGKRARREKLWRVDGAIGNQAWHNLIYTYFRGNQMIREYFRADG